MTHRLKLGRYEFHKTIATYFTLNRYHFKEGESDGGIEQTWGNIRGGEETGMVVNGRRLDFRETGDIFRTGETVQATERKELLQNKPLK